MKEKPPSAAPSRSTTFKPPPSRVDPQTGPPSLLEFDFRPDSIKAPTFSAAIVDEITTFRGGSARCAFCGGCSA
jgi:hypothetical protein